MRSYLPIIITTVFTILLTFTARGILRVSNRRIWQRKSLDKIGLYLPYLTLSMLLLMALSMRIGYSSLTTIVMTLLTICLMSSLIFIASLPLSLFLDWLHRRMKSKSSKSADPSRRRFLKVTAAAMPSVLLTSTASGFVGGYQKVRIPEIDMHFDNLPQNLEGFRILHLSDLHMGYYFQLDDLEALLTRLESYAIDMILITGDLSDDLNQLPDALKMISQFPSKNPKIISIGNHEYFRGPDAFFREVSKSSIPLLLNTGHTIQINETPVYFGGADDPVRLNADIREFIYQTTAKAMQNARQDDFKILLSHRPIALERASEFDIDLILAGHTHGGQIGFNGRSVFEERLKNERFLWGKYQMGKTRMYTSSGVGHWLPFRIGCPAEAPIIVLKNRI